MTQADRPAARVPEAAPTESGFVEAARRQAAALRADSEAIETARRLPPRWVDAFARAGFFRLCVPRSLGGPELHPRSLVQGVEELAAADGSAAWCVMIAATSSLLAGYLDPEAARRVFGAPASVAGGVFAPRGRAVRSAGGFRVSGRWSFASGCEHATWLMGGCAVEGPEGPEATSQGAPDARLMLFPASEARILDTWRVAGLCGTGSHDIEVRDLGVPAAYSVSLQSDAPREPGPLYAFPPFGLLALGVASVALGLARHALVELRALAGHKVPALARRRLAERSATQSAVAEAEAELGAARAFLLAEVGCAWEEASATGVVGLERRARLRLAATHAVRRSARCVDSMYELGGGSALYATSPLQRIFRDVHAVTQHVMVSTASLELAGRVLLGVDADTSML